MSMDELIKQVQKLQDNTTDLLSETSTSKKTLDASVDSAKGSAQSAGNSEKITKTKTAEAIAARNEAKKARDDAVPIVYKSGGSVEPAPGKHPVAGSTGCLEPGWTPLLQAMYPHSGVIGHVDKRANFYFPIEEDPKNPKHANKFTIGEKFGFSTEWNIAGRLVAVPAKTIELPAAESTAARAVAFDDVFLDWNGNVDVFRSITPHRTVTGYDADAIAKEHGYKKAKTRLYKKGDSYALLLGRLARRNQGSYHPLWNPEGCAGQGSAKNPNHSYAWCSTYSDRDATKSQMCFTLYTAGGVRSTNKESGSISATTKENGRCTKEFSDAIYADDFTPLYFSAERVIDRQALLFDSFNKAVAGNPFMAAEGTSKNTFTARDVYERGENKVIYIGGIRRKAINVEYSKLIGKPIVIQSGKNAGRIFQVKSAWHHEGQNSPCFTPIQNEDDITIPGAEAAKDHAVFKNADLFIEGFRLDRKETQPSARSSFLMVDIIGSLDAMPDEWKKNGIPGNWLAVGEEGESLIPDGTSKYYKGSRKCLKLYLALATRDKGKTWQDVTTSGDAHSWKDVMESAKNGDSFSLQKNEVRMLFYMTKANPFELSLNKKPYAIGMCIELDNGSIHDRGMLLCSNTINKIPIGDGDPTHFNFNLTDLSINLYGIDHAQYDPTHRPLRLPAKSLPAVKLFGYLSDKGIHLVYKELRFNDKYKWGDDSKFNIVDYQSTTTDLNGEKCIVGQKECELPFHFDGVTY